MKLFLDSSVLLAACGSTKGASSEIFRRAKPNGWRLIVTSYVINEVVSNLPLLSSAPSNEWARMHGDLSVTPDIFTLDRAVAFNPSKDRPILFAALAWADLLLTLDQADFGQLMAQPFYGLRVLRPGPFLEEQRELNQLK